MDMCGMQVDNYHSYTSGPSHIQLSGHIVFEDLAWPRTLSSGRRKNIRVPVFIGRGEANSRFRSTEVTDEMGHNLVLHSLSLNFAALRSTNDRILGQEESRIGKTPGLCTGRR
jgi:hypothetical protein